MNIVVQALYRASVNELATTLLLDEALTPASPNGRRAPRIEQEFRRALAISQGDVTTFLTRPISLGILVLAALALFGPYLPALWARLRGERPKAGRFAIGDDTE